MTENKNGPLPRLLAALCAVPLSTTPDQIEYPHYLRIRLVHRVKSFTPPKPYPFSASSPLPGMWLTSSRMPSGSSNSTE